MVSYSPKLLERLYLVSAGTVAANALIGLAKADAENAQSSIVVDHTAIRRMVVKSTTGEVMNKSMRKRMRQDTSANIAQRFPHGSNAGNDPLGRQMMLGNSFRSINSLDFKLVKTGTMLPRK